MTDQANPDPAELYVVIHDATGRGCYQAEVPDPVVEPGYHAATYVPKSELEAAARRAEVEASKAAGLFKALVDSEGELEAARAVCEALDARHSHYVSCLEVLTDEPLMAALARWKELRRG